MRSMRRVVVLLEPPVSSIICLSIGEEMSLEEFYIDVLVYGPLDNPPRWEDPLSIYHPKP